MSFQNELKELRAQRAKLNVDANKILTDAKNEKRDITGEENTRWEKMHADMDAHKTKIDRYEKQEDSDRHLSELRGNDQVAGREDRSGDGSQEIQISDADQARFSKRAMYRFLAGQRYAHLLQRRLPGGRWPLCGAAPKLARLRGRPHPDGARATKSAARDLGPAGIRDAIDDGHGCRCRCANRISDGIVR